MLSCAPRRTSPSRSTRHIDTIAGMGRQYFGADRSFESNLDRSARRAAWRMIRREAGMDDEG
ncbi:hypothetical protein BKD26_24145 [Streptomyces sp. CB03238]|nr:hypothetical protein BKD26_24145 [Streptomyces sp. CB03238]